MPTISRTTLSAHQSHLNEQSPLPTDWRPPELDPSELQHRFGNSVLLEFIRGHSSFAILHELVKNEYDAGGRVLQVSFGKTALEVKGNGAPIDRNGWRRLSVTLGTGPVPELSDPLQEKINGIGSKNFGLRSLFLFGDRIFVRSNGIQTLLDVHRGTPKNPQPDPTTKETLGVHIHVPYRTNTEGGLYPFTIEAETALLDDFADHISLALLKLAQGNAQRSLSQVIVTSVRTNRQIVWKQNVKQLTGTRRAITLFSRRISMKESTNGKPQLEEEYEWQKHCKLPTCF